MIRMSVSNLLCFQRYMSNEEVTLEECVSQMRGESDPSVNMLAGSALHKILEHAPESLEEISLTQNEFEFYFEGSIELQVPKIRELKGETLIQTTQGLVNLVGVVDVIGNEIGDYKLSGRFDAERLCDSYQWRCYLYMFGCHKFNYKVFVGKHDEQNENEWTIREYHELPVYAYPGMEQDIAREVTACAVFMKRYVIQEAMAA